MVEGDSWLCSIEGWDSKLKRKIADSRNKGLREDYIVSKFDNKG